MDNFVDIKQEIIDEERKDFINKIKGTSPVRGKTIKIKKKISNRPLSKDEIQENKKIKENEEIEDTKETVIHGRFNEKFIDLLEEIASYMSKKGEHFRARAYQKAQDTIINYP